MMPSLYPSVLGETVAHVTTVVKSMRLSEGVPSVDLAASMLNTHCPPPWPKASLSDQQVWVMYNSLPDE